MTDAPVLRGPAYRIHTPRLVLRCWEPADAEAQLAAITHSLEHLRAWLPWAWSEPVELDAKIKQIREFRANFDRDEDYVYAMFSRDGSTVVGGTGLHTRQGKGTLEIGYWIGREHEGRGLVTESTAALVKTAFELHGVRRVEIRCDTLNTRSFAIPTRLGFTHEGTLRQHSEARGGAPRDTMIWALTKDEYPASSCAAAEIEWFDAAGRPIPA
jgi:RimJ/RimL family protein N-acetyltransferase